MIMSRLPNTEWRRTKMRREVQAAEVTTTMNEETKAHPIDPATPRSVAKALGSKPARPKRRPRAGASREPSPGDASQVHTVVIQGMEVSVPWLSFMARGSR